MCSDILGVYAQFQKKRDIWGIITLQCSVGFPRTTLQINNNYIFILPLEPPSPRHPTHPGCHRVPVWAVFI